ncbi:hypothetical protein [Mesonia sp.]|uniref:hypothetical protein n=1 Tax=Mesonia sp. TaxID=1960830 RepID=UPI0017681033|nr:hypothetical protein [Mesonia sp.]HIB37652.1 hypothetical protein [Mesonia sp.]
MASFIVTNAQDVTVGNVSITHGSEIEEDKEKIVKIAAELDDVIYTLATKGKNFYVKTFSSGDMSHLNTKEIELPEHLRKDIEFENIVNIGDRIYVIGSMFDNKEDVYHLFGYEVSKDGSVSENQVKLFDTQVTKKRERGGFYMKSSPQKDRLLVMHAALFAKEEQIQYEIKLFDDQLNTVASHLEKVPYEDRWDLEFEISDYDVNVYGDIFLAINESYRDKKEKKNIEKFQLHAFKANNNYRKEVIDINFEDKEVINGEVFSTADGKVNIVGFFSNVRKSGRALKKLRGVYSVVVNSETNSVDNISFNDFDYNTKVKLIGERRAKKDKDVKPYYRTHSIIEKEDGGFILLSEFHTVTLGGETGFGPMRMQSITYTHNEIIITSINQDGTVAWSNVLPKQQAASFTTLAIGFWGGYLDGPLVIGGGLMIPIANLGKGPEYLSAIPIYKDHKLTVLFNDHKKNIGVKNIDDIRSMGNYNKAIPSAFVYSENGDVERIDQEDFEKHQLVLRPGVYLRKNTNEYIIYSSRKSKDKLGRMFIN